MPYKDKERQKQANREAKQRQRQGMTSKGMTTEGMTYPTGSTSFETLPEDVQHEIDEMTAWCKASGIEDDRGLRIQRAIHYQQNIRKG